MGFLLIIHHKNCTIFDVTLLFIHGFATTPEIWLPFCKPVNESRSDRDGFQNIRFPNLRFDNLERETDRIGRGMGRGMRVIGWSMGGMVAMMIAAKYPEKVSRMALVSTTPKFITSNDFPCGLPLALLRRLEKRIRKEGINAFHSLVFPDGHSAGLADLSIEQAEKELAELERADLRPLLKAIKAPTLIIHGDRDEICPPAAAAYLKDNVRESKLIILKGAGHAPMVEAPERFNKLLCWINNR